MEWPDVTRIEGNRVDTNCWERLDTFPRPGEYRWLRVTVSVPGGASQITVEMNGIRNFPAEYEAQVPEAISRVLELAAKTLGKWYSGILSRG